MAKVTLNRYVWVDFDLAIGQDHTLREHLLLEIRGGEEAEDVLDRYFIELGGDKWGPGSYQDVYGGCSVRVLDRRDVSILEYETISKFFGKAVRP